MKIIQNNPYRIIGLLIGATAKEKERQIKRLLQFLDAEQEPENDFSFSTLDGLIRTPSIVNESVTSINLNNDKIKYALFWFYNGNSITDEPAFDALKENDIDSALSIWEKLVSDKKITKRNSSAANNLATLYLSDFYRDGLGLSIDSLEKAITLKLLFLESDYSNDFIKQATDETFNSSKKELQLIFLNQIKLEIEKSGVIPISEMLDIINKIDFSAKSLFIKDFIQKPIELIELKIEESKNKRKANKSDSLIIGQSLVKSTNGQLSQIKNLIGEEDLKYNTIADKLANEILQCSIEYFNYCQDNNANSTYIETSIELAKRAKNVARGKLAKDRIIDNLSTMEGMKDKEINHAIDLLKSIKQAFEENKAKINLEVMSMKLGYNQTINWSKVENMIANSLDWDKVVSLIKEVIPQSNIEKIKNSSNQADLTEYKNLTSWLFGKLKYSHKTQVKYICYWDTSPTVPTSDDFPLWAKWAIGIFIFFILTKACS
jgi:hypothetical protein